MEGKLFIFDYKEWEYVAEVSGYKLFVSRKDKDSWKYLLFNITTVEEKGSGFSSIEAAIKYGTEAAKKLKIENDEHLIKIKRFFKK